MADVLTRFKSGKIWDFKGGIHLNQTNSLLSNQNFLMIFMCRLNNMPAQQEMY